MSEKTILCVFCNPQKYVAHWTPSGEYHNGYGIYVARPLNPVTEEHVMVIPVQHVENAGVDPKLTGSVMAVAAEWAAQYDHANIITSIGEHATQTVMHLHLHVVPRFKGDGLALPWT